MIQNWEPNWQANCRGFVEFIKFASHWSAHSEADHICKFAFHWLAQVSTDQSEALLGVYTVKPPCLGSASEYLAQILLGFAAEDLSSNTPLPRLRLGGFTLIFRALHKGLILASVRFVKILERATFLIHGWIHTLNTGEIFWAGILHSLSSRKSLLML